VRGQLQRTVTQSGQQVLPDVRDLLEPVEGEEPTGALDRVDRPEDAGETVPRTGVLLQCDQVLVQLVEVLVTLHEELLDDVVQTFHACLFPTVYRPGLPRTAMGLSARRRAP
jgi:hypothetical protein